MSHLQRYKEELIALFSRRRRFIISDKMDNRVRIQDISFKYRELLKLYSSEEMDSFGDEYLSKVRFYSVCSPLFNLKVLNIEGRGYKDSKDRGFAELDKIKPLEEKDVISILKSLPHLIELYDAYDFNNEDLKDDPLFYIASFIIWGKYDYDKTYQYGHGNEIFLLGYGTNNKMICTWDDLLYLKGTLLPLLFIREKGLFNKVKNSFERVFQS